MTRCTRDLTILTARSEFPWKMAPLGVVYLTWDTAISMATTKTEQRPATKVRTVLWGPWALRGSGISGPWERRSMGSRKSSLMRQLTAALLMGGERYSIRG